jgi:hypothetical protein
LSGLRDGASSGASVNVNGCVVGALRSSLSKLVTNYNQSIITRQQ